MKTVNLQRIAGSVLIALIVLSVSLATIGYVQASPVSTQAHIQPSGSALPCLTNAKPSPAKPQCYSPQQLWNAYDVTPLLRAGVTGKGRTIVIIAALASPTLVPELHKYDQLFGLSDPQLNVMAPFGLPVQVPPYDDLAYEEAALDVEMAHSMAPAATINLVLTGDIKNFHTDKIFFSDLLKATRYAVDHNLGDVIALSYTTGEGCLDHAYYQYQHTILQEARAKHISVLFSAGNTGAAVLTCSSSDVYFSKGTSGLDDPLATMVGGTTLHASVGQGTYQSETTWNSDEGVATGGGFSAVFPRPAYQSGVTGNRYRGEPDVAWVGDPTTGVVVGSTYQGHFSFVPTGGNRVGTAAWAGLVALFDQYSGRRLGFLNAGLYRILQSKASYSQAFHDITTGNNTVSVFGQKGLITVTGYKAGPGWDAVTGLGTPKVAALASLLKQFVYANDGNNL